MSAQALDNLAVKGYTEPISGTWSQDDLEFVTKYTALTNGIGSKLQELPTRCFYLDGHPVCSAPFTEEDVRFQSLILNGPWRELVDAHFGGSSNHGLLLAERHYGRRTRHQMLHRDLDKLPREKLHSINIFIALQSTSLQSGATQVHMYSHLDDFEKNRKDLNFTDTPSRNDQVIDLCADQPGVWYAFNSETAHRATKNLSGAERTPLFLQFCTAKTMQVPYMALQSYRSQWSKKTHLFRTME
jgi:hypothetical protein